MGTTLDTTRAELALLVLYLNKAEARDKICRAIQYGSKFISNGEPGTAQNVDKTTSLARKVFRLFKVATFLYPFCWNFHLILLIYVENMISDIFEKTGEKDNT
jgi:Peroxisomal biogenesis factor 11 (PEX11)